MTREIAARLKTRREGIRPTALAYAQDLVPYGRAKTLRIRVANPGIAAVHCASGFFTVIQKRRARHRQEQERGDSGSSALVTAVTIAVNVPRLVVIAQDDRRPCTLGKSRDVLGQEPTEAFDTPGDFMTRKSNTRWSSSSPVP